MTLLGLEPVELAGEWPPGAPTGICTTSWRGGLPGQLWIDHADPRVVFSAELVDSLVDHPHPSAFVDLTGCRTYIGALLKIRAANRQVVYRLTDWLPSIRAYVGEWPE